MKYHPLIRPRTTLGIIFGMALASGVITSPARADLWDKRTILTVNQTIQVTDTVLQPGQYVLRLLDSQVDRHVVQIFNRDQTQIIDTVIAIPQQRMQAADRSTFTFWETPSGSNRALRTWFYPGDTIGQEFLYPKYLQQVAMVTTTNEFQAAVQAPESAPTAAEPAPAEPPAQAVPQADNATPQQTAEQPVETAQNTTPAPDQTQTPETPAHSQPMQQLPKTGSPYPEIGLAGAVLLCLGGLLRIRREA
jgi:LPXTG-motif cell wall-anchored protein